MLCEIAFLRVPYHSRRILLLLLAQNPTILRGATGLQTSGTEYDNKLPRNTVNAYKRVIA